jgi:hypothetical protein
MIFSMSPLTALLALAAALFCFHSPNQLQAADKLRVSHCYIGGAILPLWLAKDAGLRALRVLCGEVSLSCLSERVF